MDSSGVYALIHALWVSKTEAMKEMIVTQLRTLQESTVQPVILLSLDSMLIIIIAHFGASSLVKVVSCDPICKDFQLHATQYSIQ